MDVFPVNWDSVPEVMNKEQFFRICHISKSTALHLLKSGKVPCEWSGKKTRCYKIRKEDVKAYLDERAIFPELYSAPLSIAVMGCAVNGPGEASDADLGVACGRGQALLFSHGQIIGKVAEDQIVDALMAEVDKLIEEK